MLSLSWLVQTYCTWVMGCGLGEGDAGDSLGGGAQAAAPTFTFALSPIAAQRCPVLPSSAQQH